MQFPAPPAPEFPPDQLFTNPLYPRYEDCTQDGRLNTLAIPPGLATMWNARDARTTGNRQARASGLVSLLTRLTVASLEQPVRVNRPFEAVVGFQLAHDRDAAGEVSRLFLNIWADVRGRPHLPAERRAADTGALVVAGHAFAEHTYTRPFGPPEQRRVTSLAGIDGVPAIPEVRYHQPAPASAAEAPAGARWLDELAADPVETAFLLDHTDANQHVNSLVYVRVFLDAAGRRIAAGGHPPRLRSRAFDIAYRKPSFAGERVRAHIRTFAHGEHVGVAGFLAAAGEEARPRCYVRVLYGA
ncbi:MAG TPA: hypothetical protein VK601_16980 [Kofleriaceae bacterium]|nr:hypothetical protein [Kofleriaceae bacterium]